MNKPLSAHDALIYVMVMASAVDSTMNDREMDKDRPIDRIPAGFPGFR